MSKLRQQVLILYWAWLCRDVTGDDAIDVSVEGALTRMAR